MKKLTSLILVLFTAFVLVSTSACKKCKNEDPAARIVNNGTEKADVQVKTSGGNTVNINNVMPGTSSPYASYAPGQVTFTINVSTTSAEKTLDVASCFDYDIVIDGSNNISVTAKDRND